VIQFACHAAKGLSHFGATCKGTTAMPRRRASAFDDLLSFATRLPWKVSVGLAFGSYVALHLVALGSSQSPAATNPPDLGNVVIRGFIHVFALFTQYIIPVGFLIGAAVSFIKRRRSIGLLDEARTGRDIASISWHEFERLVGEGFRQRGFKVTERGGASPDGGVDLELTRADKRYLVQCKHWRVRQVGVTVIRELCGVMATEKGPWRLHCYVRSFHLRGDRICSTQPHRIDRRDRVTTIDRAGTPFPSRRRIRSLGDADTSGGPSLFGVRKTDGRENSKKGHDDRPSFLGMPKLPSMPPHRAENNVDHNG
jgi:Restriction endonuclease